MTAPTPAGVPVKIRSPGARRKSFERYEIASGTFQMSWLRSPDCLRAPFTSSQIAPGVRVSDGARRCDLADRPGRLERLGDLPRPPRLLRDVLQVAPRHVEPDRIAEDVAERRVDGDVLAAFAERHHQLDLVVHVLRRRTGRENRRRPARDCRGSSGKRTAAPCRDRRPSRRRVRHSCGRRNRPGAPGRARSCRGS